jgi:hypothetical protein
MTLWLHSITIRWHWGCLSTKDREQQIFDNFGNDHQDTLNRKFFVSWKDVSNTQWLWPPAPVYPTFFEKWFYLKVSPPWLKIYKNMQFCDIAKCLCCSIYTHNNISFRILTLLLKGFKFFIVSFPASWADIWNKKWSLYQILCTSQ